MLVSPTEPPKLRDVGRVSSVPEKNGCDYLISVVRDGERNRVGIQRKEFPNDFFSSLADGRLYDLLGKMQQVERRVLIIEGYGNWTQDGQLHTPIRDWRGMTWGQYVGLLLSIMWEFNMPVLHTRDLNQTRDLLLAMERWAQKKEHTSLLARPGVEKDSWGRVSVRRRHIHIMQGWPMLGPKKAGAIVDRFNGAPLSFTVSVEELTEVPGIGKATAQKMVALLNEWVEPERESEREGESK